MLAWEDSPGRVDRLKAPETSKSGLLGSGKLSHGPRRHQADSSFLARQGQGPSLQPEDQCLWRGLDPGPSETRVPRASTSHSHCEARIPRSRLPVGTSVAHMQVCLWRGHSRMIWGQETGGSVPGGGLSLLIPPAGPPQLPIAPTCPLTLHPLPPWLMWCEGTFRKRSSLAATSPASIFSLSLPVCSHPSVCLHLGAVPMPFA